MLKKLTLLTAVILVFAGVSAYAASGCKNGKFLGSYTRVDPPTDVFGDGTVVHQFFFHLVLTADGAATQYWSGTLDFPINTGSATPNMGSWTCRGDGKLVITFLNAGFAPDAGGPDHPSPDIGLVFNQRVTLLLSVDDDNTMTRLLVRVRNYGPSDDPTNASGGTLGPLSTRSVTYRRLVASDADLNLP